jgi:hypothetical protein
LRSALRGALLAALLATAVLVVAGCGADRPGAPGTAASANRGAAVRNGAAAQATAQTEFGLLAGGDYGRAWDLWTEAAQQAVSRDDFVRLTSTCRPQLGVLTEVVSVHGIDDNTVDVTWKRGAATGVDRLLYSGGSWRYQPAEPTLDGYRLGHACDQLGR